MKNLFYACCSVLFFVSCGVTIDSIVDNNLAKSYNNPLMVIPYEKYQTGTFSANLKNNLEKTFSLNNRKIEVLLVASKEEELTLNAEDDISTKINQRINEDNKDIVILFKPTELQYYNGGLQKATYQIIAVDVMTEREVWKANFSSSGTFGPSTFAQASAEKIYQKLRMDNIIE